MAVPRRLSLIALTSTLCAVFSRALRYSLTPPLPVVPPCAQQDTIQTFYDITKQEVLNLENQISKKDREMEQMEDNHRVEVRVYLQKVKHLEYGAFGTTHSPPTPPRPAARDSPPTTTSSRVSSRISTRAQEQS